HAPGLFVEPGSGAPEDWFAPGGPAPLLEAECERRLRAMAAAFRAPGRPSPVAPPGALEGLFLDTAVPHEPVGLHAYLDRLERDVVAHSPDTAAPGVLAHMTSALPSFARPLAALVAAMNQNLVRADASRAVTPCERQTVGMMHRLVYGEGEAFYGRHVQDPASTLGVVVSGGTLANVAALWVSRNRALGPVPGFAGIEEEGMASALEAHGCRGAAVVGSALMHYSFDKAAGMLGLGARSLVRVPVDAQQRVDVRELRRAMDDCRARGVRVLAVVGVAGTTDAGSVDPLDEVAEVAAEAGAHFHVDAAWGGALLFSERHRALLAGIERADSVTLDAHKQLFLPLGLSLALFRDPAAAAAIERHANYILREGTADLGRRTPEGSRPAAALHLHAALHLLGRSGYRRLVDEGVRKARYLADAVRRAPDFQLLTEPQTNIVLYRYLPPALRGPGGGPLGDSAAARVDELNVELQQLQGERGRSFVSRTLVAGPAADPRLRVALRAVVASPVTGEADLDAVLQEQREIGRELAPEAGGRS
ncbi:MAG TPA: pyridoxal-dependent decarboxylase, partial [Longimicrobiaceae bacterium]|nr:pyridoxal-dependent decarboxylase [Longimicrobiaceae bacterium]